MITRYIVFYENENFAREIIDYPTQHNRRRIGQIMRRLREQGAIEVSVQFIEGGV